MLFRHTIKLVIVAMLLTPVIPTAGWPGWGALGVPMQANVPLLDRSYYSSFWVWRTIDRERRLREAWTKKFGENGPPPPHPFLNDLNLDQFQ